MRAFSISVAWEETRAILIRDGRLYVSVALALIALPSAINTLINPGGGMNASNAPAWIGVVTLVASLIALGRGAEAVPIIDECVARVADKNVSPRMVLYLVDTRLRHFEQAKDAEGCRATAELWEKLKRTDAASIYDAACFRAVTAAVMRGNPTSQLARQSDAEADRAMALLQQAVAAGRGNVTEMKKDKDLDVLHDREDYRRLMAELETRK